MIAMKMRIPITENIAIKAFEVLKRLLQNETRADKVIYLLIPFLSEFPPVDDPLD